MKKVTFIVVHCSDSDFGSTNEIRRWHQEKGWRDIGYHFVIMNGHPLSTFTLPCLNGSIDMGRTLDGDNFIEPDEVGAHALGYNEVAIGICGVAKKEWTKSQIASLVILIRDLQRVFNIPTKNVIGHYETESGKAQGKTCPNLDMNEIRRLVDGV